jgi:hypothetical protein
VTWDLRIDTEDGTLVSVTGIGTIEEVGDIITDTLLENPDEPKLYVEYDIEDEDS